MYLSFSSAKDCAGEQVHSGASTEVSSALLEFPIDVYRLDVFSSSTNKFTKTKSLIAWEIMTKCITHFKYNKSPPC
jgi:hypothetical protein